MAESKKLDSVNSVLMDRAITHAVYLEGLKRHEANRVLDFLALDFFPDLQEKLSSRLATIKAKGFDRSPATTKRLQDLSDYTLAVTLKATGKITDDQIARLKELAKSEASGIRDTVLAVVRPGLAVPAQFDFVSPPIANLNAIVTSRPFEGRVLKDWWAANARHFSGDVEKQIRIGLAQGETIDQITGRVFGLAGKTATGSAALLRHNAEAVTITAVAHVTNSAREEAFARNAKLAKGVMIVATLDLRTTLICRGQDGKVYPIGEGWRPPGHFRCRTTTTLVLKSAKELGLKTKDGAENVVGTRSSLDGVVPGDTTQDDWLRRQPEDVQDFVFKGKEKADVFRRGKLKLDQFTDEHGRELTLRELEALERAANERFDPPPPPPAPPAPPPDRPPTPAPAPAGTPAPEPLETGPEIRAKLETIAKQNEAAIEAARARSAEAVRVQIELNKPIAGDTRAPHEIARELHKAIDATKIAFDAENAIVNGARAKERAVLALPVSERLSIEVRNKPPRSIAETFETGKAFVESIVRKTATASRADTTGETYGLGVKAIAAQRSRYQPGTHSVELSRYSLVRAVVHEIGHAVETASGWIPRSREFLLRRAAGEPSQRLSKLYPGVRYGKTERAFKDKFEDAYVGKDYGDRATEIVSMGLEYLWRDPAGFARRDPDFFDFVIGLIRGTS